jgi:hypothetical protein
LPPYCCTRQAQKNSLQTGMLKFLKQNRYAQITAYLAAIVLLLALAVYGVMEQSSFADAVVESFVE